MLGHYRSFPIQASTWIFAFLGFINLATVSGFSGKSQNIYLCVVAEEQPLIRTNDGENPTNSTTILRRGTVVIGQQKTKLGNQSGWTIVSTGFSPQKFIGWVPANSVQTPAQLAKSLLSSKREVLIKSETDVQPLSRFPELIARQSNTSYRKAWTQVSQAFIQNKKLPASAQLPEPFFARADIWRSAGSYSMALSDYLDGMRVARERNLDLSKYIDVFEKISDTAKLARKFPEVATGSHLSLIDYAQQSFGRGVDMFKSGKFENAVNLLSESISCRPTEPIYWYYRSISYLSKGNLDRATHDALVGAFLERRTTRNTRGNNSRALTPVQGEKRQFLEGFRNGTSQINPAE